MQEKRVDRPKPNLFIVGATKAGTTSLHNYLRAHPQIFMSDPKEPGFFLGPKVSKFKNMEDYLQIFKDSEDFFIRGESSTGYTHYPKRTGVAHRIHEFNPRAFIIYIIRDPIERTISHYWWNVRWEGERRDPFEAIIEDSFYQTVSYYALQIRQYLDFFPKSQVKIVVLEELKKTPLIIKDIYEWLGVDSSFVPSNINYRFNPTPIVLTQSRILFLEKLRHSLFWNIVGSLIPKSIRSCLRKSNELYINRSKYDFRKIISILRPIQQNQTMALSKLLNRDFLEWKVLYSKD